MQYALLVYENEDNAVDPESFDGTKVAVAFEHFVENLEDMGAFVEGGKLPSVKDAVTVRVRGGEVQRTEGPFAATEEQLGGVFLIEADDFADAVEMATEVPVARTGCIEVRPVIEL